MNKTGACLAVGTAMVLVATAGCGDDSGDGGGGGGTSSSSSSAASTSTSTSTSTSASSTSTSTSTSGSGTSSSSGGMCVMFGGDCAPSDTCCDAAGETGQCYAFGMGSKCTIPCPPNPDDCPNNGMGCNNMDPAVCRTPN